MEASDLKHIDINGWLLAELVPVGLSRFYGVCVPGFWKSIGSRAIDSSFRGWFSAPLGCGERGSLA